jgi:hypothetical protein
MHIHLPKPLHGWREFLGEVGIIVIGVLIALGAEQVVETLHWREAVDTERDAFRKEIAADLAGAQFRLLQEPCVKRRLSDLLIIFQRHKQGKELGLAGPVGSPRVLGTESGAWTTAGGGQTIDHMPLDERLEFGSSFAGFAQLSDRMQQESFIWDELRRLDHAELLEREDWAALRGTYAKAVAMGGRTAFFANWVLQDSPHGIKPEPLPKETLDVARTKGICGPLLKPEQR